MFIDAYKVYLKTNVLDLNPIKIIDQEEKTQLEMIVKNIGVISVI